MPMRVLLSIPSVLVLLLACTGLSAAEKPRVNTVPKEPVQAQIASSKTEKIESLTPKTGSPFVIQTSSSQPTSSQAAHPSWEAPFHWQGQDLGSLRKGSWLVKEGEAKVDISVLAFPGETGGLLANINRWAQQVGLQALEPESLENIVQTYSVSDRSAQYVSLVNTKGGLALVGVIVPVGEVFWFFKMMGNAALVEKETAAFHQFLKTVQF